MCHLGDVAVAARDLARGQPVLINIEVAPGHVEIVPVTEFELHWSRSGRRDRKRAGQL